ncbi:hypothetical protein Tco_1059842, partial [Tanacetum coccineum]
MESINVLASLPLIGSTKKQNLNKFCDYHGDKGNNANDCYHLKKQIEEAVASGKLAHLVKDIRRVIKETESIFSLCYLFRKSFSLTSIENENTIRTPGDYCRPSHEGYRNTFELLDGNNVEDKSREAGTKESIAAEDESRDIKRNNLDDRTYRETKEVEEVEKESEESEEEEDDLEYFDTFPTIEELDLLLKDMDQDSAHMVAASKVPMLKPGEYEIWRMRIEHYIQMIDYALWEVIKNGATLPKTKIVEGVMTEMPITTVEEKDTRRLEVKARSTLMMVIPNEHQLKFNSIKDA